MSRHDGVSCDSCLKGNFRGRRYKCLICYDYDLCATCYEAGATTTRHTVDHPMQCILTRSDFDLYYGGEALTAEAPQAFTCPYCGKMGFTESTLQEHVTSEHADSTIEVVCPVCAALPGGDPNHVTDDFAAHLTLEHRAPRDFDEPTGIRHVRRIPHPGRGVGGTRARRANMHFAPATGSLSGMSPSGRETMDPIAELLSHLTGVRRSVIAGTPQQLEELQRQLQFERQQAQAMRQQLERLPRRQNDSSSSSRTPSSGATATLDITSATSSSSSASNSQFLLARCNEPSLSEQEQQTLETERADKSLFVQELLLSTLTEQLQLKDTPEEEVCLESNSQAQEDILLPLPSSEDPGGPQEAPSTPAPATPSVRPKKNMLRHIDNDKKREKEPPPLS